MIFRGLIESVTLIPNGPSTFELLEDYDPLLPIALELQNFPMRISARTNESTGLSAGTSGGNEIRSEAGER